MINFDNIFSPSQLLIAGLKLKRLSSLRLHKNIVKETNEINIICKWIFQQNCCLVFEAVYDNVHDKILNIITIRDVTSDNNLELQFGYWRYIDLRL